MLQKTIMKRIILLQVLMTLWLQQPVQAQTADSLITLPGEGFTVQYSNGHRERAVAISLRIEKAMAAYSQLLHFTPTVTLLVLSTADWSRYTRFPVYGMPHYTGEKVLVVAAEDNAFWKSFLPPPDQLPAAIRASVQTVYSDGNGGVSMRAFFDLLALHELGHAFHFQGKLTMQRKWLGELFANILLHTYVAEHEPEALPALTLFPQMVVGGGSSAFTYTSLKDIEERYEEIGQQYPKNYGWYQCRWHLAAKNIYDSAGKQAAQKLWEALQNNQAQLSDEQLPGFLETQAHKAIADVMNNWERDMVK